MKMKLWNDCTPVQQIERIDQAARVVENLPEHERRKHWDMGKWGLKTECGTVACAAGHCGLDTWFRRRGLQLNLSERNYPTGRSGMFYAEDVVSFFGDEVYGLVFTGPINTAGQAVRALKKYAKELRKAAA